MTHLLSRFVLAAPPLDAVMATIACADIEEVPGDEDAAAASEEPATGVKVETGFSHPRGETKDMAILNELVRLSTTRSPDRASTSRSTASRARAGEGRQRQPAGVQEREAARVRLHGLAQLDDVGERASTTSCSFGSGTTRRTTRS